MALRKFFFKKSLLALACSATAGVSVAELIGLDDALMEDVTGQTGLTVEIHRQQEISEIKYSDVDETSGSIIDLKDIVIGDPTDVNNTQARTVHIIDVDGNDGIVVRSIYDPTRIQIGSISVGDHRGTPVDGYATRKSFGTVMYDFEGTRELKISGRPVGDTGITINSTTNITNSDLRWQTNGNTLLIDNLAYNATLTDMTIDVMDDGSHAYLNFGIPSYAFDFTLGGLCFAEMTNCAADGSDSVGSLSGALAFRNSYVKIYGGGRNGVGITMDSYFEIDDTQTNFLTYTDDSALHMGDMSGSVTTTGFTFDVETADPVIGDHIAMQVDSVVGNFKAGDLQIGGQQLGQFEVQFDFSDGTHDAQLFQNKLKLAPGIAWAGQTFSIDSAFDSYMNDFYSAGAGITSTSDGISLYSEWNLGAEILYTDNLNTINISNFQSHGKGYASVDVRNDGSKNYLAFGIVDFQGSYSMDGLKVGKSANDPKDNAKLQGGTELLLPLGIYPSYDFTMNGGVKVYTGGKTGSGLTMDGDILITDGTFALSTNILNYDDGNPSNDRVVGVWADDVRYEYHFRDYTLDVENNGIKLVQGELWSDMDIGNLRWGEKNGGESLGRIRLQRYQTESTLEIKAGGAGGASCIGGTGADISACEAAGGYWVDKGDQGVTIALKQNWLQENVAEGKKNMLMWENNRVGGVNDTGTQLIFDNITTTDGYDDNTNTHGVQLSLAVDVAPTRVVKRTTGTDSNGISGTRGQEKIMSADGTTYTYKDTSALTPEDKDNRPIGFAVSSQLQFKEMSIGAVQLKHPNNPTPQTVVHGLSMQNFNITSNLTATPIQ